MKILLVRLRLIGDVVFTTPLIRALRQRFPDAFLSYVVEPAAAPVGSGLACPVHRLPSRYRELILEEVRSYSDSEEEAQQELRDLFSAFA